MNLLKNALIFVASVAAIALLVGFVLPQHWQLEREAQLSLGSRDLHETVGDVETWNDWSPWSPLVDSTVKLTPSQPSTGVGATLAWDGKDLGRGSLAITASDRDKGVEFDVTQAGSAEKIHGTFAYDEQPSGATIVRFTLRGALGGNPITRYKGLLRNYTMGPVLADTLTRLSRSATLHRR